MATTELIPLRDGGVLEVIAMGKDPQVVLIPSARRGADDFAVLANDLLHAGFGSVALNLRGIGRSSPHVDEPTLRNVADDIADVINATSVGPMHVVGHAQGNIFARVTAAYRPEVVRSVSLLACGGHDLADSPPSVEVVENFERCARTDLSDSERVHSLAVVFFAAGNDASVWLDGWWPSGDVRHALTNTDPSEWATAGNAPVLIVQPLEDAMSPAQVGRTLHQMLGERSTYVEVPLCGHAMLPEQPEMIAREVIRFLHECDAANAPDSARRGSGP
jgi:pimeloyl-ACP methyl ester carboxylesterase